MAASASSFTSFAAASFDFVSPTPLTPPGMLERLVLSGRLLVRCLVCRVGVSALWRQCHHHRCGRDSQPHHDKHDSRPAPPYLLAMEHPGCRESLSPPYPKRFPIVFCVRCGRRLSCVVSRGAATSHPLVHPHTQLQFGASFLSSPTHRRTMLTARCRPSAPWCSPSLSASASTTAASRKPRRTTLLSKYQVLAVHAPYRH